MDTLKYNRTLILIITVSVSLLFAYMLRGVFIPIVFAAIFAGLLFPIYRKLSDKTGKASFGAALTILIFIAVVQIPGTLVLVGLSGQAEQIANGNVEEIAREIESVEDLSVQSLMQHLPPELARYEAAISDKFADSAAAAGEFVAKNLKKLSSGTSEFLFFSFVFVFVLYYFLKNGRDYLNRFFYFLPFDDDQKKKLLARFIDVSKATISGTLVLNVSQGIVAAIGMYFLGVPYPLFWGFVLSIATLIPGVGTISVWGSAAIYLALHGEYTNAIIMVFWGVFAISKIDNLLRPQLVGKSAGLPPLMVFLSTMGGLSLFGLAGVVLGPLVAAMFMFTWGVYAKAFASVLDHEDEGQTS